MKPTQYKLTIPGKLPGLNEYIKAERTNRYKAAKLKKSAEETICWHIKSQLPKKITNPVYMHYLWIEPNKKRDRDNITFGRKLIQDSLVKMNVLANDGWSNILGFTDIFEVDKNNPRVEVTITEVGT